MEDADDPLLRDGFVYEMLIAHEHQHNETMLQLIQMVDGYEPVLRESFDPPPGNGDPARAAQPSRDGMVLCDGGEVEVGAGPDGFAYDNERPRHSVEVAPF